MKETSNKEGIIVYDLSPLEWQIKRSYKIGYSYYWSNTHRSHVWVDRLYESYKDSLNQWGEKFFLIFAYAKNKGADQLCGNCTADQVLCFTTWIVQSLNFLNPKFQVYSQLLWLYSLVCVGPGWKSRRQLFSQHSSYKTWWQGDSNEHPQHRLKELHQQGASNKCAQLMFI